MKWLEFEYRKSNGEVSQRQVLVFDTFYQDGDKTILTLECDPSIDFGGLEKVAIYEQQMLDFFDGKISEKPKLDLPPGFSWKNFRIDGILTEGFIEKLKK